MACVGCDDWPVPADVPGCCDAPEGFDPALALILWRGAIRLVQRIVGPCWQVCHHTFDLCRPCSCPEGCNPCCCRQRVQVPWVCGTVESVTSNGVALDPADWNLHAGWLWPTSCSWPCQVTIRIAVGDPPDPAILTAAKTLWCKLLRHCDPSTCDLPDGTVSVTGPDGVTVEIRPLDEWLAKDLLGISFSDIMLAGFRCPEPEVRMIDPMDWQGAIFQ